MLKGFRGNTFSSCPIFLRSNKMTTGTATFHGWTNYATWRVNIELLDTCEYDDVTAETNVEELSKRLQQSTFDYIDESCSDRTLVYGWANAFVEQVNFYEIAAHIIGSRV